MFPEMLVVGEAIEPTVTEVKLLQPEFPITVTVYVFAARPVGSSAVDPFDQV